jgi:hypothetical protein
MTCRAWAQLVNRCASETWIVSSSVPARRNRPTSKRVQFSGAGHAKPPAYVDMTPNDRDWSAHPGNLHQVRHLKHAPDITRAILLGAIRSTSIPSGSRETALPACWQEQPSRAWPARAERCRTRPLRYQSRRKKVVGGAVCSEPVSAANFPEYTGIYREFSRFRPKLRVSGQQKRQYISALAGKFPTQSNREFNWPNREFLRGYQGNCPVEQGLPGSI